MNVEIRQPQQGEIIMNVLVTGGAGFIGSHLVDALIKRDYTITVYDNLSSGKTEFIQQHFDTDTFRFIKADLLDEAAVRAAMKDQDVVFHIAANPDVRRGADEPIIASQIAGDWAMMEIYDKFVKSIDKIIENSPSDEVIEAVCQILCLENANS